MTPDGPAAARPPRPGRLRLAPARRPGPPQHERMPLPAAGRVLRRPGARPCATCRCNRYPDAQMTQLREALAAHHAHPVRGHVDRERIERDPHGAAAWRTAARPPRGRLRAHVSPALRACAPHAHRPRVAAARGAVRADRGRHRRRRSPPRPTSSSCARPTTPPATRSPSRSSPRAGVAHLGARHRRRGLHRVRRRERPQADGRHRNVAVVRTFSKAFAMAGVRLGYVLTSPDVVRRPPARTTPVPHVLAHAGRGHGGAAPRRTRRWTILDAIRAQRDRLVRRSCARMDGVTVYPIRRELRAVRPAAARRRGVAGLLDRGVLVRDLSTVVPNALRVTAGDRG